MLKIIIKNLLSNYKNLFIYFINSILSVAIFFIFCAINTCSEFITQMANIASGISGFIFSALFLVSIVSILIISYSHSFYIKTRNHDYGIMLLVGINKRFLYLLTTGEILVVAILSIVFGSIAGAIISQLLFYVLKNINLIPNIDYKISALNYSITMITFASINLIIILFNLLKSRKMSIRNFLTSSQEKEYTNEKHWYIGFVGVIMVVYGIKLLFREDIIYTILSIVPVTTGIYIIISYWASVIIKLVKLNPKAYYRKMLPLHEYAFKFKQNKKILFIYFIVNFLFIFLVGSTLVSFLELSKKEYIDYRYPFDIVCISDKNLISKTHETIKDTENLISIDSKLIQELIQENELTYKESESRYYSISLSDYNCLTSEDEQLEEGEILFVGQSIEATTSVPYNGVEIILGVPENYYSYKIKKMFWQPIIGHRLASDLKYILVFNDSDFDEIISKFPMSNISLIDLIDSAESSIVDKYKIGGNQRIFEKQFIVKVYNSENLFVTIVMLLIGLILSFSCCCVLFLKTISDNKNMARKYNFFYCIGMTENQIKKNISSEYNIFYLIPMLLALIISYMYFCFSIGIFKTDIDFINLINPIIYYSITAAVYIILQLMYCICIKNWTINMIMNSIKCTKKFNY